MIIQLITAQSPEINLITISAGLDLTTNRQQCVMASGQYLGDQNV